MFNKSVTRRTALAGAAVGMLLAQAQFAAAQAKKWDLSVYLPLSTPAVQMLVEFAKDVGTATNGEVVISVRAAGELPYAASDYHRAVGEGEIAMADSAFFTADIPAAGVLTSAFLLQGYGDISAAMDVALPKINEQLDRFGAEVLFWTAYAPVKMWGKGQPVTAIKDINGMKVRALSAENAELLTALGAVPVTLATPEVMTALQYGTVDAILTSPYGLQSNSWVSAFDWSLDLAVAMTPTYVLVSKQLMAELSPENQQAVRDVAAKYAAPWLKLAEDIETTSLHEIQEAGVVYNVPSDEDRAKLIELAQPIWAKWAEARGGDTAEILDAVRAAVGR